MTTEIMFGFLPLQTAERLHYASFPRIGTAKNSFFLIFSSFELRKKFFFQAYHYFMASSLVFLGLGPVQVLAMRVDTQS